MFYGKENEKNNESVYKKTPSVGFGWGQEGGNTFIFHFLLRIIHNNT